jgi:hypothetical protein
MDHSNDACGPGFPARTRQTRELAGGMLAQQGLSEALLQFLRLHILEQKAPA